MRYVLGKISPDTHHFLEKVKSPQNAPEPVDSIYRGGISEKLQASLAE